MKIREFIQATFRGRADKAGALVVYDARKRYHNLVLAMADDHFSVMDATESFIAAHERAVESWAAKDTNHYYAEGGYGFYRVETRECLKCHLVMARKIIPE